MTNIDKNENPKLKLKAVRDMELIAKEFPTRVIGENIGVDQKIDVEDLAFGDPISMTVSDTTIVDYFDQGNYPVPAPIIFSIEHATLNSQFGLLTIENFIALESSFHFPSFLFDYYHKFGNPNRPTSMSVPDRMAGLEIEAGYSMCAGIQENYYHWIIMFLGKICQEFVESDSYRSLSTPPILLFPNFLNEMQRETATAISEHFNLSQISMKMDLTVAVKRLIFPVAFRAGFLRPDYRVNEVFHILKAKFWTYDREMPKKLYISRRDNENRKMVNELEVEKLLNSYGFTCITLTGLSIRQQIQYFAHADQVIGPHGAGLTNIGFCRPGTKVLELHIPSHLNWCYRRIANVAGLHYGFLYGALVKDGDFYINLKTYIIDIERLDGVLNSQLWK